MSWEAWQDETQEVPEGWWVAEQVDEVVRAIQALHEEPLYENSRPELGISPKFLARITVLRLRAGMVEPEDALVVEALSLLGELA